MALGAKTPIWTASGAEKRARVKTMFSEIAPSYDLINSLMSGRLHYRWRSLAVNQLELSMGESALDVCCGTGAFAPLLRKAVGGSGQVFGIDFAAPMLEIAAKQHRSDGQFVLGDALNLPVPSGRFAGVTVGWGIRNVADIDHAHREIARVLKDGGRFVSLDMALPKSPFIRACSSAIFRVMAPAIGGLFGKSNAYAYLQKSTERFWTRDELDQSMMRAGFTDVGHRDFMLGNICLHWGTKR